MKEINKAFLKQFNNIKYLFLSVLFFSALIFTEKVMMQPEDYKIKTEDVEADLHELENELDVLLNLMKLEIDSGKTEYQNETSLWHFQEDFSNFSKKGFTVLVYKNDSLKYWSDNSFSISPFLSESSYDKVRVIELSNGWYEIREQKHEDIALIGFIKLKNKFSFQNKYLENYFRKELEVPSSMKISEIPVSHGVNIKDSSGEYVLSLVPVNKVNPETSYAELACIFYFLSFAFLLLYLSHLFLKISEKKNSVYFLLGITFVILIARHFMIEYKFPFFIYSLSFFNVDVYAGDGLYRYLGDFLINSMLIMFLSVNVFRIFQIEKIIEYFSKKSKLIIYFLTLLLLSASAVFLHYISDLISNLINHSTISFEIHKVLKINIFTISAFFICSILLVSFIFIIDKTLRILSLFVKFKEFLLIFSVSVLVSAIVYYFLLKHYYISSFIFYGIILFTIGIIRFFKNEYRFYTVVILIFICSSFITFFVNHQVQEKEEEKQEVLITELEDVRDDVAELLLQEINLRIQKDTVLINKLSNIVTDHQQIIHAYMESKYFTGFWKKYKLVITVCGNSMFYTANNQADNCEKYYKAQLEQFGIKIGKTNFWFFVNRDGTISYFGFLKVPKEKDDRQISVYIRLDEKLVTKTLGYPELLLDNTTTRNSDLAEYSFAKYTKGKLVSRSGVYQYDLSDKIFKGNTQSSHFLNYAGFKHHITESSEGKVLVISKENPRLVDFVTSFAYLFVFLNIIVLVSIFIDNYKFLFKRLKPDFKNKIQLSFFLILTLTFVLFGAGTLYYAIEQHNQIQNKEMSEKIQSVLIELEHKLSDETELIPEWKSDKYDHLDDLLVKFSQVFFSDINLYDLKGFLLATSRPEIFKRGLIGKQINRNAFTEMSLNKKSQFIQNEYIGSLEYASVYIPFKNKENKIIAYINLPFFGNNFNLQKNISNLLITTINIYVILFIITIVIAFVISGRITQPLRMLQSKFKNIELGKEKQEIKYNKEDEIGELVKEYNRMVNELEKSVKRLAESERESAWREMAKQIAHEIKNPLTPMKLSVQLLLRSRKDNQEDFDRRLNNVAETLIEQIDTLSAIASEFSAFAKMPKAQNEEVEMCSKIKSVVHLFENSNDIDISLELYGNENIKIIADKEQLSRVFINIIKNGIQSIPTGIKGKIFVELTTYGNNVKVTIEDNGAGIPEDKKDKLFKPSFTTKTKGMGMGLAIVKNIVLNAGGEIWFESEENKGTKFFVEFPVM